jgi:hypothetical protein
MAHELDLLLRLRAFERGRAVRGATHLHVAIRPDALVVCPVAMAGEDTTIHIMAWGGIGQRPRISCVPDPRQRDEQYRLFTEFGAPIEHYFLTCRRHGTYPQLWVSSAPAVSHLDILADRLRYNRLDTRVKRCGELLSYATERYPLDGEQTLHTVTGALKRHWVTGQTESEDEHLGALLTWIEPPSGCSVLAAVAAAERVPMGVKTDPQFDQDVLAPLVTAYNKARRAHATPAELAQRARLIRNALEPVVLGIYDATQRGIQMLRNSGLPPLSALGELERREMAEFASFMASRDAGYPLPLRDTPKAAVFKLAAREDATENVEAMVLAGDRVARARGQLTGHVLVGVVEGPRVTKLGPRRMVYTLTLRSTQRVLRLRPRDELCWVEDPRLRVVVNGVQRTGASTYVALQILSGQRAVGLPSAGTRLEFVPKVPCWAWLGQVRTHLKTRLAVTPWTHAPGGIPSSPARPAPPDPLLAVEALR